jgi:hypothetical protein
MRQKGRVRSLAALLALLLAACPTPRRYAVVQPGLSCERAMRVAYGTMQQIGYKVTEVVEPTPAGAGRIAGVKTQADGETHRGAVRITCDARQVMLQPVESDLIPSFEFSREFDYSFQAMVKQPDVDGPMDSGGLEVALEAIDGPRAQLDFGGWPLRGEQTLVRVTVRNGSDRPVVIEGDRVSLVDDAGNMVTRLTGAALADSVAPDSAVRDRLLSRERVAAGATVERFLVFPPGRYGEAQVAVEDVETGETDGFQLPVR